MTLAAAFLPLGTAFALAVAATAAHRRLGFTHDQLRDWFDQVGFDCSTIVDVDPPAGDDGLTVTVWLALNRRTIKKIA